MEGCRVKVIWWPSILRHVNEARQVMKHIAPLGILACVLLLLACGTSAPAVDPPQRYVALAHNYWIQYKAAEGDVSLFTTVCWGNPSAFGPGDAGDPSVVNPPRCREVAAAILKAHESYLSNLEATRAPAKFAADDQVLRTQLTKAIADVKAMIAAADDGNREAVIQYMTAYVNDMVPRVLSALDDVDPSVAHD
jgi:hypothetical protein